MPRLRSSAGFKSDGTKCQQLGPQVDCILATRIPIKVFREPDSEFNKCKTILESDQKVTEVGLILNSSRMVLASLEATSEAISSRCGMVAFHSGVTLAFAATSHISAPLSAGHS